MFNQERSYIVPTVFSPNDLGMFSIYPPEDDRYFGSYWDTCREQFAKKFLEHSFGFFLSTNENTIAVPVFISSCENLLQLNKKTIFFETDMKNVIFLRPSQFWMDCYMKRSLFTLLCRIGIFYKNKNFENQLFGEVEDVKIEKISDCYKFARNTKPAIMRFFGGYNQYIGFGPDRDDIFPEKHGWVQEFQNKNHDYIKKVLVNGLDKKKILKYYGNNIFFS